MTGDGKAGPAGSTQDSTEHQSSSRPKPSEAPTRKPLDLWDRLKLIVLFLAAWLVLFWAALAQFDPVITPREAFDDTLRSYWWLLALAGLEALRQVHFLISEHSAGYHRFWTKRVFGGFSRRVGRMDDWTRYRLARVLKVLFLLLILDLVVAQIYNLPPSIALFQLPLLFFQALPFVLQIGFGFFFIILQFVGLYWFLSRGGIDVYMPDDIETRFTDVKGQDVVLERVKENIIYLEDPESIEEKGGYVPGGILLWGPPGTGKTLMAQAVAGETNRPFVFVDPGAFIQMFMGVGVLKVKGLYRKLRRLALRYGGVIVFFDEADSLGSRGNIGQGGWNRTAGATPWSPAPGCNGLAYLSPGTAGAIFHVDAGTDPPDPRRGLKDAIIMGMGGGGGMGTLQALLSEMSGLSKPRGFFNRIVRRVLGMRPKPPPKYRILHIFATNMPQALDEAMLRPGRVDRTYKVGYPTKEGRKATYYYYLDRVKHELTDDDVDRLATITPYATGATIKDVVNEALAMAIRDGRETITWPDVMRARQFKEHGLPDEAEYLERERHAVAVHEACHAVVAYRARRHMVIDMATIERRGDIGGFVSSIPPEDQFFFWRSEREADIMTSLASLAGERMFFEGDNSGGVGSDLRNATAVATLMEGYWGMGDGIGSHGVSKFTVTGGRASATAEDGQDRNLLETELGRRVEQKLAHLYERTWQMLEENRTAVLAVTHALESHRTMSGDDVVAVLEGTPGPLVDGRPYHSPEFIELVEEYHIQALEAHKAHSRPKAPLPVYAGALSAAYSAEPSEDGPRAEPETEVSES